MGRNILYDEVADAIYIVDFERSIFADIDAMPSRWSRFDGWDTEYDSGE